MYKKAKKEVQKVISDAKSKADDDLNNNLATREGQIFSSLVELGKGKVENQIMPNA